MMSKVTTASLYGLDVALTCVETDIAQGLPGLSVVGLPDLTVRESKERVRAAIANAGGRFPMGRITVNLSPADNRKGGSHFDLPIAVGILIANAGTGEEETAGAAFLGELSLDGAINRCETCVALVLGLREQGVTRVFLPKDNLPQVLNIEGMAYYPASHLREVIAHLSGETLIKSITSPDAAAKSAVQGGNQHIQPADALIRTCGDFSEVKGQEAAKRAIQISAAGRHNILMMGPPGTGKSMLASRIPTILPPLQRAEILEISKIYSIAGQLPPDGSLISERPFRAPHHSITPTALVGGGFRPRPGELSLAHGGVLFLDELPEFDRRALDMLRQPLEDRYIDLSRVGYRNRYPCRFILVAAMNPCPCGYRGSPRHACTCAEQVWRRYAGRVSGPLLDRMDIHITVGDMDYKELNKTREGSASTDLLSGVIRAAQMQDERYRKTGILCNGELDPERMSRFCEIAPEAKSLLKKAYEAYGFSARQERKMLRLARTIADIEGSDRICSAHIAEAVSYRRTEVL